MTLKRLIPDAKVISTAISTPSIALLISYFFKLPTEVSLAIAAVIGGAIGYFTPRRSNVDHDVDLSGL